MSDAPRYHPAIRPLVGLVVGVYILSGIVAFGHCSSAYRLEGKHLYMAPLSGIGALIFNPLYWSWVCFEEHNTPKVEK
jgi:hypothetical protein